MPKPAATRGPCDKPFGVRRKGESGLAEAIVNTVRQPLLVLDSRLRVVYANRSFCQDFQVVRSALEGHELESLQGWQLGSLRVQIEESLRNGTELIARHVPLVLPRLGKRTLVVSGRRLQCATRRDSLILLAIEDGSSGRVSDGALKDKLAALEQSNADLEQFALAAAHDLQEPLRMIGSFTQILAKDQFGKLGANSDESITFIVDGVKRMQALVNDLLAYARLAAREPQLQEIESEEVLQDVLDDLAMCIAEASTTVTHDPLPRLMADPGQMHELLQNLIANALKFRSASAPAIHISARRCPHDWEFSVRDNGIGIAQEYQETIFGVFKRLHSRTKFEGTGMGLAICRKIAERHGGRIWVESQPGLGSTFCFTVPVAEKDERV